MATSSKVAKSNNTNASQSEAKMSLTDFISWWLDPKNGKVGGAYKLENGQQRVTNSFHAVTSGFNDLVRSYYGVEPQEVTKKLEDLKLITTRPVGKGKYGKGVSGIRIYPYNPNANSGQNGKVISLKAEMGIS